MPPSAWQKTKDIPFTDIFYCKSFVRTLIDTNEQPELRICFEIQLNRITIAKYSHLECRLAYCDHGKYPALGKSFSLAYDITYGHRTPYSG